MRKNSWIKHMLPVKINIMQVRNTQPELEEYFEAHLKIKITVNYVFSWIIYWGILRSVEFTFLYFFVCMA